MAALQVSRHLLPSSFQSAHQTETHAQRLGLHAVDKWSFFLFLSNCLFSLMEQLRAHTPAKWTGSLLGPMFPCTAYVGFTHSHYVYNTTNDEITRMPTRTRARQKTERLQATSATETNATANGIQCAVSVSQAKRKRRRERERARDRYAVPRGTVCYS